MAYHDSDAPTRHDTTPAEVLEESKRRLDDLLPERDAAVFASNAGMETSEWENAFVEALAIAYKSTDALSDAITAALAVLKKERRAIGHVCTHCGYCDATIYGDGLNAAHESDKQRVFIEAFVQGSDWERLMCGLPKGNPNGPKARAEAILRESALVAEEGL